MWACGNCVLWQPMFCSQLQPSILQPSSLQPSVLQTQHTAYYSPAYYNQHIIHTLHWLHASQIHTCSHALASEASFAHKKTLCETHIQCMACFIALPLSLS